MPATINGIGTQYYGKKNLQQRPGACAQCRSNTTLSSYDTRLWFVIIFIPIIPLGRKRIIDACPCCRRHFVSDLRQWQAAKQLETSGALEQFRSSPTPENAIEAHKQLLKFQQTQDALELQGTMLEKFPDNAKIHLYFGQVMIFLGRIVEADPLFARALELRPDLPQARIGVAETCRRKGQLDQARQLLDFLEKPGAAQLYSLASLEGLARAFQQASRHAEALELFTKLLEALPGIAQHKGFRKTVKNSEQALGRKTSILPKAKFSLRQLLTPYRSPNATAPRLTWHSLGIVGLCLLLILTAFLISNEHTRRHRLLFFVNTLQSPLQAELTGFGHVNIGRGITSITLPEGHYQTKITGAIEQELEFDISTSYGSRWSGKPVWVINPGSDALLLREQAHYSRNPTPITWEFYFGQSFYAFSHIDHPFQALPRSVRVSAGEKERVLSRLERSPIAPAKAIIYLANQKRLDEAYRLAEWRLRIDPSDEEMVKTYAQIGEDKDTRVEEFLRAGLTNRPVQIEWHRAFQNQHLYKPGAERLLSTYYDLLKSDPNNSALLYLYGRILGDHVKGTVYLEEASRLDPHNAYPLYALANDQCSMGNWKAAKALLDRAVELRPKDPDMLELWETACMGAEQVEVAEKLFKERVSEEPTDLFSTVRLSAALVAQGKTNEAEELVISFTRSNSAGSGQAQVQAAKESLFYATARFAALEKIATNDLSSNGRAALFSALVEQNRLQEAVNFYSPDKLNDPINCLVASLAFRFAGQSAEAELWQTNTLNILKQGGADSHQAASLLKGEISPSEVALRKILWPARVKALLLADLSLLHPERQSELGSAARRLNKERIFPYYLVQRATAAQ